MEQKKKFNWTKEEDDLLEDAIRNSIYNKAKAIREVAEKLNRKEATVAYRWYSVLSNPEHKKYRGCLFTTVGYSSTMSNRSISRIDCHITPIKIKKSIWARIKELLHLS